MFPQPLKDVKIIPPGEKSGAGEDNEIENKFDFRDKFKNLPNQGLDPVLQENQGSIKSPESIVQNFDGMPMSCNCAPPDPNGDVGPNHYFQMVNVSFEIFNKSGTSLYGPADNSTLWDGFTGPWTGHNDGDPVVIYDQFADRWIASQFALYTSGSNGFYELIAVSATPDPTGAWYRYAFQFTNFPDYPKLGVWRDGYYLSTNEFNAAGTAFLGPGAIVIDRAAMLAGNPTATMVYFNPGTSYGSLLPSDADGIDLPPVGAPGYFVEMDVNVLRVWNLSVDWTNPANSTLTLGVSLPTAAFNLLGYSDLIPQPGTSVKLDNLGDRLMFRAQYRKFAGHQSIVVNHTVDAGSLRAGIRWYELRNTGSGWSIYQQGTYAPADGLNRWMGSIAMNANGDIALGYSVASSSVYPSIRFTGRAAGDPLGTMTIAEQSIFAGTTSQTGPTRWGDYSAMTVDPVDDNTFWFTTEYSNGGWNWRTRIASFVLYTAGPPVADFFASNTNPAINTTVNFFDNSTNVPTSWSWTFSPNTITYMGGTNSASQNPQVQFNALGQYTVSLTATNSYGSDPEIKTNYINVVPFSYCIPTYTYGTTDGDYISLVQLGSINNATGAAPSPYYTDYTSLSTSLLTNSAYGVTVSAGTYASLNNISVWIDYNQNGVFDAAEKLGNVTLGAMPATGTINFTVPSAAASGTTRMRVREVYNNTAMDPCTNESYGETEDYTVMIQAPAILVDLTAFLEGPFNGTHEMISGIIRVCSFKSALQYGSMELHRHRKRGRISSQYDRLGTGRIAGCGFGGSGHQRNTDCTQSGFHPQRRQDR